MPELPPEPTDIVPPPKSADKLDIMSRNCSELKKSLAQLQGQMNALAAEKEKPNEPAEAARKNKNKKNKSKACPMKERIQNSNDADKIAKVKISTVETIEKIELVPLLPNDLAETGEADAIVTVNVDANTSESISLIEENKTLSNQEITTENECNDVLPSTTSHINENLVISNESDNIVSTS